jgi:hypothetical protein
MARKRYSREECRERGQVALIASVVALALLVGTWIYAQKRIAECGHVHVCVKYIILDVIVPVFAAWSVWDWARYRRELHSRKKRKGRHGK